MPKIGLLGFSFLLSDTVFAFTHLYNFLLMAVLEEHNNCEIIIFFFRKRVLQTLATVVMSVNFFDEHSVEVWDAVTYLSEIVLHGKGCNVWGLSPISSTSLTSIGSPLCQHCSSLFQDLSDRIRLHWRRWRTVFRFPLPRAGKQQKAAECKDIQKGRRTVCESGCTEEYRARHKVAIVEGTKLLFQKLQYYPYLVVLNNCEGLKMPYSSSVL